MGLGKLFGRKDKKAQPEQKQKVTERKGSDSSSEDKSKENQAAAEQQRQAFEAAKKPQAAPSAPPSPQAAPAPALAPAPTQYPADIDFSDFDAAMDDLAEHQKKVDRSTAKAQQSAAELWQARANVANQKVRYEEALRRDGKKLADRVANKEPLQIW